MPLQKRRGDSFAITLGWNYAGPPSTYRIEVSLGTGGASAFSPAHTIFTDYDEPGSVASAARDLRLAGVIPANMVAQTYDVRGRILYAGNPVASLVAAQVYMIFAEPTFSGFTILPVSQRVGDIW